MLQVGAVVDQLEKVATKQAELEAVQRQCASIEVKLDRLRDQDAQTRRELDASQASFEKEQSARAGVVLARVAVHT